MCYTLESSANRPVNVNAVRRLYAAARAVKKEKNIQAADCLLNNVLAKQEVDYMLLPVLSRKKKLELV